MKRYPSLFGFSVSHTTRQPRPGEENGIHYHFVDRETIESGIAAGAFIEHANVHTNIYGTSHAAVEKVQKAGKICILDIDIQGVQQVKQSNLITCNYVFVSPPSIEELESRLRGRGTETEEKIRVRLNNAKGEMQFGHEPGNFDAIIINEELEIAFQHLVEYLRGWYPNTDFDNMVPDEKK